MLNNIEARELERIRSLKFSEEARTETLIAQLRACTSSRNLKRGKKVHAAAVRCGDESDIYIASALLNMYSKCGSIKDAEVVFHGISSHNVVTWTTMVAGYNDNGQEKLALDFFHRLVGEGCKPSAHTFVAAVKVCSNIARQKEFEGEDGKVLALKAGIDIHLQAGRARLDTATFVANTLVDMYSNCGNMVLARRVFESIEFPDVISWTSLIAGYAENGEEAVALEIFEAMLRKERFCAPNARTFVAAIKACAGLAARESVVHGVRLSSLEKGMALHSQVAAFGMTPDVFVANTLVDLYGKCGTMAYARDVFDRIAHRTVVSWTALMLGYVENGEADVAMELFWSIIEAGDIKPDSRTYVAAVKACTGLAAREESINLEGKLVKATSLERGFYIHSLASHKGFPSDTVLGNALINMYVKCGSLEDAHKVFENMNFHGAVSWTELIFGYVESGEEKVALSLFRRLLDRDSDIMDAPVLASALKACTGLAEKERGAQVDGKVIKAEALEIGMALHSFAAKAGVDSDAFVSSSLMEVYAKCGTLPDTSSVFFRSSRLENQVMPWTVLILGYSSAGDAARALEMFKLARSKVVMPDSQLYAAGLKVCSSLANSRAAKDIHAEICRRGMEVGGVLATCLVNCYSKCGSLEDAQRIFDMLASSSRSLLTWNALFAGYASEGKSVGQVLELFSDMQCENVQADDVTYLLLLAAFSHTGSIDQCLDKFVEMKRERGLSPGIEHYHCMVDALGRIDAVEEALAMAREMPYDSNAVTLRTVLCACARSKRVDLAKVALEGGGNFGMRVGDNTGAVYMLMANTLLK